jgi:hypothetical protein
MQCLPSLATGVHVAPRAGYAPFTVNCISRRGSRLVQPLRPAQRHGLSLRSGERLKSLLVKEVCVSFYGT